MTFQDHFSRRAPGYRRYRPHYPDALFQYLVGISPGRVRAWDCATGSGQAAVGLARHVEMVVASDASEAQIRQAEAARGVHYLVTTAEAAALSERSMDLVIVAQALHWIKTGLFYDEVKRLLRPRGILAAIAYGLPRVTSAVDGAVDHLYREVVGPYWPAERYHIDTAYSELAFPFVPEDTPSFEMRTEWACDHLVGYMRTWSAVCRYTDDRGHDPVAGVEDDLRQAWGVARERVVRWPLVVRCGRRP